jgi:hypothetical protein
MHVLAYILIHLLQKLNFDVFQFFFRFYQKNMRFSASIQIDSSFIDIENVLMIGIITRTHRFRWCYKIAKIYFERILQKTATYLELLTSSYQLKKVTHAPILKNCWENLGYDVRYRKK